MTWTRHGEPIPAEYWFPTLVVGDTLVARPQPGLAAWASGTDTVAWTLDVTRQSSSGAQELVSDGTRVATYGAIREAPHPVVCCDARSGEDAWTTELDLEPTDNGISFSDHGLLVRGATTEDAFLAALDPETGDETMRVKSPNGLGVYAAGTGVFLPGFKSLFFLDGLGDEPREICDQAVGTVLVDGDTVLAITGKRWGVTEATVRRWSADGSAKGSITFPAENLGARLVALDGDRVAVFRGTGQGILVVDVGAGEVVWEGEGRKGFSVPGATVVDGKLVAWIRADNTVLRTWDAASGEHLGDLDVPAFYAMSSVADELVLSSADELRRFRWSEGG